MPHYSTGAFWGYREEAAVWSRPPRARPQGSVSPMKLSPVIVDELGVPGYDYFARNGDAPEEFGDWIEIPWQCRAASWTLRGGPLEVQVSYDGVAAGETRVLRASTTTLDSFVAYRVRQLVAGYGVWYQLIAII